MSKRAVLDTAPDRTPTTPEEVDEVGPVQLGPLAVDAQPAAAAEELDLATAETLQGESETDPRATAGRPPTLDSSGAGARDTGDLYGVRTPHAGDTELSAPEHLDAFEGAERGENWTEALAEHAAESGPAPEEEVVILDDTDSERGHHPTESGDRPVADKGSGGPGGL